MCELSARQWSLSVQQDEKESSLYHGGTEALIIARFRPVRINGASIPARTFPWGTRETALSRKNKTLLHALKSGKRRDDEYNGQREGKRRKVQLYPNRAGTYFTYNRNVAKEHRTAN